MEIIKKNLLSLVIFSVCIILICAGFIVFRANAVTSQVANYNETWTATSGIYTASGTYGGVYYVPSIPVYSYCGPATGAQCSVTVTGWSVTGSVSSPQ